MGAFSIWHWLIVLLVLIVLQALPFWMILKKAGYAPSLALLSIVPGLNVFLLWFLALAQWPSLNARR